MTDLANAVAETEQVPGPDPAVVRAIWDDAVDAPGWQGTPVWLHGDLHPANVLTADGTFCGVIDFGDLCAGDPALDLAAGWILLPEVEAVERFRAANPLAMDDATWRRARGWAVWRALGSLLVASAGDPGGKPSWGPPALASLHRLIESVASRPILESPISRLGPKGAPAGTVGGRTERRSSIALGQEPLDLSNGFADVAEAQPTRSEGTAAVLAERRKGREDTGDGAGHLGHLAVRRCLVVAVDSKRRCLGRAPCGAERVGAHVCDCGGLLGGVGRCSGGRCGCVSSSCTCVSASTSDGFADVEIARSEAARLIDRGSRSRVAGNGDLVDAEHMLGAVGRPRCDEATVVDAEGLRRGGHRGSVGETEDRVGREQARDAPP